VGRDCVQADRDAENGGAAVEDVVCIPLSVSESSSQA
jgi:hypothetical protein